MGAASRECASSDDESTTDIAEPIERILVRLVPPRWGSIRVRMVRSSRRRWGRVCRAERETGLCPRLPAPPEGGWRPNSGASQGCERGLRVSCPGPRAWTGATRAGHKSAARGSIRMERATLVASVHRSSARPEGTQRDDRTQESRPWTARTEEHLVPRTECRRRRFRPPSRVLSAQRYCRSAAGERERSDRRARPRSSRLLTLGEGTFGA